MPPSPPPTLGHRAFDRGGAQAQWPSERRTAATGAGGAARGAGDDGAEALLATIRSATIGARQAFVTPYGERRMVYCDHVASGRALRFVEDCASRANDSTCPFAAPVPCRVLLAHCAPRAASR